MAKQPAGELVGTIPCPCCESDAEVRRSKGHGYGYWHCPDCGTQGYTRSGHASGLLLARCRHADPERTDPPPAPQPAPTPKKKGGDWLEDL